MADHPAASSAISYLMNARHRAARLAGALAVLLVHALLALALWSAHAPAPRGEAADVRTQPITVWLPQQTAATADRTAAKPRPASSAQMPVAPSATGAPVATVAPSTAINPDWQGEITGAAKRSAGQPEADRAQANFSPPPRPLSRPCKTPPSAFRFEYEEPRTWGNLRGLGQEKEEAYSHLFDDMKRADQPQGSVPPTECQPGS